MKIKLFTICLLLSTSQLSYGDEKILNCLMNDNERVFKHTKSSLVYNIFERIDASWKDWCITNNKYLRLSNGNVLKGCKIISSREITKSGGVCREEYAGENGGECIFSKGTNLYEYKNNKTTIDFLFNKVEQTFTVEDKIDGEIKEITLNHSCSVIKSK